MQKLEKAQVKRLAQVIDLENSPLNQFVFFKLKDSIWATTQEAASFEIKHLKIVRKGLKLCRIFPHSLKLTTNGIQLWARFFKYGKISLTKEEAFKFIKGDTLILKDKNTSTHYKKRFVIAYFENLPLGVGLLKGKILKSQVPRSRRVKGKIE